MAVQRANRREEGCRERERERGIYQSIEPSQLLNHCATFQALLSPLRPADQAGRKYSQSISQTVCLYYRHAELNLPPRVHRVESEPLCPDHLLQQPPHCLITCFFCCSFLSCLFSCPNWALRFIYHLHFLVYSHLFVGYYYLRYDLSGLYQPAGCSPLSAPDAEKQLQKMKYVFNKPLQIIQS